MTTSMQSAFIAAGIPETIFDTVGDSDGFDAAQQAGEISWIGGRYVHACPIPHGYLMRRIEINATLQQRSVTSHVRFVSDERAVDEGYTSPTEFAQAMMREHLQETAHISAAVSDTAMVGDRLVKHGHLPPANDKPRPKWLKQHPDWTSDKPRVFNVSEMVEKPQDLVDEQAFDADIVGQMRALVSLSDWDPALAYAQLKEWDGLCAMYERLHFNTCEAGVKTQQEVQRLYREADAANDEIPRAQVERLNERLQGLRVQAYNFARKFKMAKQERERAVAQSGMNFSAYMPIAERAKFGAAAHRAKKRTRVEIDLLNALPAEELARLHRHGLFGYRPRGDGVDSPEGNNPVTMGTDE